MQRLAIVLLGTLLATFFWLSSPCVAASLWEHNGSIVSLEVAGNKRTFYYYLPRPELPVSQGTVVFEGRYDHVEYSGTAYRFSERCGPIGYAVAGEISEDKKKITLRGKAPRRNDSCAVIGYKDDRLEFVFSSAMPLSSPATDANPQKEAVEYIGLFNGTTSSLSQIGPNYKGAYFSISIGYSNEADGGGDEAHIAGALHVYNNDTDDSGIAIDFLISLSGEKPAYNRQYLFNKGNLNGTLEFQRTNNGQFWWNQAVVDFTYEGKSHQVIVDDEVFFAPYFANCPLLSEASEEEINIKAHKDALADIVSVAAKENWFVSDWLEKENKLVNRKLRMKDFDCETEGADCETRVAVGSGREFEAMNVLSQLEGVRCVDFSHRGAGSYFEALQNIPMGTLFDSVDAVQFAKVGEKVRNLVLQVLSGEGTNISNAKQLGTETRFTINALVPNTIAKFSEKTGYWYFIGMSFTVDFDDFRKRTETLFMSLNDVVEVKFPETSKEPPSSEIVENDGRSLLFTNPDNEITKDGRRMVEWTVWMLSEFSKTVGGNVFSNSLETVQ